MLSPFEKLLVKSFRPLCRVGPVVSRNDPGSFELHVSFELQSLFALDFVPDLIIVKLTDRPLRRLTVVDYRLERALFLDRLLVLL